MAAEFRETFASPYQLIHSDSAILIRNGGSEIKLDLLVEGDPIPAQLMLLQFRRGLLSWLELSSNISYARFPDENISRISEYNVTAKIHFRTLRALGFRYFFLLKYRRALGDPIITEYEGDLENVDRVVSPHADGGKDISLALLGRNDFRLFKRRYVYSIGLEYTRAEVRDYIDFTEDQTDVVSLLFSTQTWFLKNSLMLAIENKYTYWVERGDFLDSIPQVRWEFTPGWVFEVGVSFPVIGGNTRRYLMGFTFEF